MNIAEFSYWPEERRDEWRLRVLCDGSSCPGGQHFYQAYCSEKPHPGDAREYVEWIKFKLQGFGCASAVEDAIVPPEEVVA